ncbi:hypothetical protein [Caldivirga maquilingensis]|uniref:Uncharacterized protein n=1 Tax=Caldivirga maquilingensis (strain ATCC 700844 / DSM 13496 / JCM 10307 / IC-167) TaxID=397948 RepID=A8MA32_CALMQ|nr:hypothetical protein [Caldivirga maquilingensis]ABW00964.1 hypothetical protein Cmaq_0110 [Caldivirga maquilingensis IC-167]
MSSEKKPDEKKQTPQVPPPPILTPQPQPITQGQQNQQGGQVNPIVKPPTQQAPSLPQIPSQYTPPPTQQPQRPMMQPTQAPQVPYASPTLPPPLPYQRVPPQQAPQQAPIQYPPQYPQYPPALPPMMQQYPPQPPPQQFIRPEEQLSVSGDVHRAFRYAMVVGVPLAVGGIVIALLASLAISIPAYVYLIMGVSVVLLSIALIITNYSWFRSLRILESEIGKINQRLSNLQQARAPPMQTQPMMPLPQQMQQRYVMPPLPPPYMQQPQGASEGASDSNDFTQ